MDLRESRLARLNIRSALKLTMLRLLFLHIAAGRKQQQQQQQQRVAAICQTALLYSVYDYKLELIKEAG